MRVQVYLFSSQHVIKIALNIDIGMNDSVSLKV